MSLSMSADRKCNEQEEEENEIVEVEKNAENVRMEKIYLFLHLIFRSKYKKKPKNERNR